MVSMEEEEEEEEEGEEELRQGRQRLCKPGRFFVCFSSFASEIT